MERSIPSRARKRTRCCWCSAAMGKAERAQPNGVGQKPNIINVAVSRAKYRLGVIGDYDLWKNIPYVGTVCKYLEKGR